VDAYTALEKQVTDAYHSLADGATTLATTAINYLTGICFRGEDDSSTRRGSSGSREDTQPTANGGRDLRPIGRGSSGERRDNPSGERD